MIHNIYRGKRSLWNSSLRFVTVNCLDRQEEAKDKVVNGTQKESGKEGGPSPRPQKLRTFQRSMQVISPR